jgi:hypothetical protein
MLDVDDLSVATLSAPDIERTHAVGAHVLQRHGLDLVTKTCGSHWLNRSLMFEPA